MLKIWKWLIDDESDRMKKAAERVRQKYESEAVYDWRGSRWGRQGELIT